MSAGETEPLERHAALQLIALAAGPSVVLAGMLLKAVLVPWSCRHGSVAILHAVSAVSVTLAFASAWLAAREWRRAGGGWPDHGGGRRGRSRFLAVQGMLLSLVAALVMAAQWIPDLILSPCQH
jgi:hypothetical protein